MNTQHKGDLAELAVAADLTKRGYQVAFPFGTSLDWDLALIREARVIERIQVKYSSMLKNGTIKIRAGDFDYLAVYCPEVEKIYYVRASDMPEGGQLYLRVRPPKNGADCGKIRWARDYETI